MVNNYEFIKSLKSDELKELVRRGLISSTLYNWVLIFETYNEKKLSTKKKNAEIITELSEEKKYSENSIYRIISFFLKT